MKCKKINKVLVLSVLMSIFLIPLNFNYSIATDESDPNVTIVLNTDEPTNQDITITVETSDDLSGIKEIVLPDGTKVTDEEKTTYIVTENGSYEFKVYDKAMNETKGVVDIDFIDKIKPTLKLTPSTTKPTNKDVVITVESIDGQSGIKEVLLPDGTTVTEEVSNYTVTENGTYKFKVVDMAGNMEEKEITISNIDKVPPVITIEDYNKEWTNQDITVKVSTDKGTLNETEYTFTENGSFTFIATDEAGNITEEIVEIINIDKVRPILKIIVGE